MAGSIIQQWMERIFWVVILLGAGGFAVFKLAKIFGVEKWIKNRKKN